VWQVAVIIGSHQEARASAQVSPTLPRSDRAAIGLAIQRFVGPVNAYCRRADAEAWRYALAAGATDVRYLEAVTGLDFDVMLVGSGGAEPYGDLLLAQLAAEKQCAMVCEVLDVVDGPHGLTVTRDLGRGSTEVLALDRPAVLGIAAEATQLLYVSRYRRQVVDALVREPPSEPLSEPLAALSSPWEPARPRVYLADLDARTAGSASTRLQRLFGVGAAPPQGNDRSHIIAADAATCAQHLLRFMSHHGMITAPMAPPVPAMRSVESVDSQRQRVATTRQAPHGRGPRPLTGAVEGAARQPRPFNGLLPLVVAGLSGDVVPPRRAPRPLDAPAPPRRGPRTIEAPRQDETE
jgi:hypothetical protein